MGSSGAVDAAEPKERRADDRKVMNAIFYVLRTGMPWRDLPDRYGPYTTAYNRFNRWSRRGIWKKIFDRLASKSRRQSVSDRQPRFVKAHRAASGAKGGRKIRRSASAAGGGARKSTAIVDAKGRPLNFIVTGGQVHDSRVVEEGAGHVQSAARRRRRQGLRQPEGASADQG